ncbi:activating signal cointegrator 1 complex subunit 2-like [Thunnus thynnus]|uniref:activating signal cointegrator 1 complex subunit 2-like n=1 Tax=Thunnus thynnus TaxID=8237 RepID=UPI003527BF5D
MQRSSVHRTLFLTFLRMATHKESKENIFNQQPSYYSDLDETVPIYRPAARTIPRHCRRRRQSRSLCSRYPEICSPTEGLGVTDSRMK